jgi:ubiquinone/menaquinone biosynthesis C-methylase UbiE
MKAKSVVNLNSEVYYHGTYWNDIPLVFEYMCQNFTGDKKKWWIDDFKERYGKAPFKHGLFLNCGDGRHEFEFYDKEIVKKITAFDVSPNLIKTAKKNKGKRNIKFIVGDANKIKFKKEEFDLIVNIAAIHHVQYVNRLCRILANSLKSEGTFVNFEYIGPHRNQYPFLEWNLMKLIHNLMAENVKNNKFGYPHLPTMLVSDPTEAIHSELIIDTIKRYFDIREKHDTGGGIAYHLLTHNENIMKVNKRVQKKTVKQILKLDSLFTRLRLVPALFTYFVAVPDKDLLLDKLRLTKFQKDEDDRELRAAKVDGTYRFKDYYKLIQNCSNLRDKLFMLKKYVISSLKYI